MYLNSLILCPFALFLEPCQCVSEHLPSDRLSTATQAHYHDRVPRVLGLVELDDLGEGNLNAL